MSRSQDTYTEAQPAERGIAKSDPKSFHYETKFQSVIDVGKTKYSSRILTEFPGKGPLDISTKSKAKACIMWLDVTLQEMQIRCATKLPIIRCLLLFSSDRILY